MEVCVLCKKLIENLIENGTQLKVDGRDSINNVSLKYGDNVEANIGDWVHENCRRKYVSENHLKTRLNSNQDTNNNDFNFETCCLFCGADTKLSKKKDLDHVTVSEELLQSIKNATEKRYNHLNNDEWANQVSNRIFSGSDLIGVKVLFHNNCRIGYRTNKPNPNKKKSQHTKPEYRKGFSDVINLIQSSEQQQYSIHELIYEMNKFSDGNAYSFNQMKANVQKHFGDQVIISSVKNKKTLVTLRTKCYEILNEFYESSRNENEKQRAIQRAGDIIISDIKQLPPNKDFYPSTSELTVTEAQKFMPESLTSILNKIVNGNGALLKIVAIGQAIIQTNHRENVMSPLQIALAAQMSHYTGSRFVVSTLNELGFGSTYGEVRKFQLSAATALHQKRLNTSNEKLPVIKYVGDNVDHNVRTLDGKNTFHGMGIISIHTPLRKSCGKIPRIKTKLQDVKELGMVDIIPYFEKITPTTTLFYRKLNRTEIQDPNSHLDLLWKMSWSEHTVRPMWSGMMEMVQQGSYPEKPTINFLPIIDMNPNDLTCINSMLHFICKDAKKFNAYPSVTFDQPLWFKARNIVENEPESSPIKGLVVCLGGFHLKMSYLGSIGHIMSGSGLDVTLAQTYAENSVIHMLSGKAYARAIRGHFMVDSALNSIIFNEILHEEQLSQQVDDLLLSVIDKKQDINELKNHEILKKIGMLFAKKKEILKKDATSRLWLQYMNMIDNLKSNIRADRTGNFKLHLETLGQMLPVFPASGHNLYTKSVYIYLQDMKRLEVDNPTIFSYFSDGNFTTRRTDRYWGGLPDDLIIEQVLMRSLKTSGGPTRGRGMDEAKLSLWLLSLPARAEINNAIQDLTNLKTETSEQHKECGKSRSIRDNKDITCTHNFLKERNPFAGTTPNSLRNIADGIISSSKSNVDKAEEIGLQILKSLEDKNVFEYSFEKCKQVVKMSSKNEILIDGEMVHIDPETLFQRLLMLILQSNYTEEEKEDVFTYELCHKAPSLFDADGFIREASSSTLVKNLVTKIGGIIDNTLEFEKLPDVVYVLEGDWLIDKINWKKGESFDEIFERHAVFLKDKFEKATIVFECGSSPSTSDETWLRETKGVQGMEVLFSSDMNLKIKKETFLQNRKNKLRFIELLAKKLVDNGFTISITFDNVVVTVATLVAQLSESHDIVVVGKQVDLIMVLCHYAVEDNFSIFYLYEETSKTPLQAFKITEMKKRLGSVKSKYLLFVHAMGGCRTTSQLHNISKISLFPKLDQDRFAQLAELFCCPDSSEECIIKAGNEVILLLYNGKAKETMKNLRYRKFTEKSKRCTSAVTSKMLPPTEAAVKFHILRVYCQVQEWMQNKLNPLNFGWVERNSLLRPVTTNLPAAPASILANIRCGCQKDCDSARCTCFKYGFKCTTACKICAGCSCSNCSPIDTVDLDNDLDEED